MSSDPNVSHPDATHPDADADMPEAPQSVEPGATEPQPGAALRPAHWAWRFAIPVSVVLMTLTVFVPALAAGFVHWDDDDLLFGATYYQDFTREALTWMWSTTFAGHFQPLTWISYSLDYQWDGYNPIAFHVTNVALHLINAALFYFLAVRLLRRGVSQERVRKSRALLLSAGVAAIVFAIHPLRAESVAWIAERRDVLSGLFYLLSIHCYVSYASSWTRRPTDPSIPASRAGGTAWFLASFACFFAATLSNASAVMLPLILLVLDAYPLKRVSAATRDGRRKLALAILEKMPFFAVAFVVGVMAILAQHAVGALYPLSEHTFAMRAAQACYGLAFYVWKTVLPIGLGPLYPIPERSVLFGWMLSAGLATLVALAWLAFATRRRFPVVWVAMVAFALQLLPVAGILQSGPQLVADRYSYLPCMGFAILAGAACLHLMLKPGLWSDARARSLGVLAIAVIVAGLAHATFRQASYWDSPLTLWRRGVEVSPDCSIAHVNLADAWGEMGNPALAMRQYRLGLLLNPRDSIAASHLGRVYARAGAHEQAARMLAYGLKLDPERSADYRRLAMSLVWSGRPADAVAVLRDRARHAPHEIETIELLSELLATYPQPEIRNGAEAVRWAKRAYSVRGKDNAAALLRLATALAEDGQFERATSTAEEGLQIAQKSKNAGMTAELTRRLALFRSGQPYHFGS